MRLYYLLNGAATTYWGFLKPSFLDHAAAGTIVRAAMVDVDLMMSDWILNILPLAKSLGYSHNQIVEMAEHAFFMKYQMTSFDPATGMADIVLRNKQAFTTTYSGMPIATKGKLIVFGVALAIGILWSLFSDHKREWVIRPREPLWLMRYKEVVWYADLIAHTTPGNIYYQVCEAEGAKMTSHAQNIDDIGGKYDRFVFLGTFMDYLEGMFFWYWWDWWYWDVLYIGDLEHVGPNLYKLKKPFVDRFAPSPGSVKKVGSICGGVISLRNQMARKVVREDENKWL